MQEVKYPVAKIKDPVTKPPFLKEEEKNMQKLNTKII